MKTINLPYETMKTSITNLENAKQIITRLGGSIDLADRGYNVAWFPKADYGQLHKARTMCHSLVKFGCIIESEHWVMLPFRAK